MKKSIIVIILLLFLKTVSSCWLFISEEDSKFSDEVNRYNFLDKVHDLQYIYDFESLLNEAEIIELKENLKDFEKKSDIAIIIVSNETIGRQENIVEASKVLNEIFSRKYNLNKTVVIEISPQTRQIGISSSESLEHILTDSICDKILKESIGPYLKKDQYFKGLQSGVKDVVREIRKYE